MKKYKEKIISILEFIYGLGIAVSLFVGAFSFFGYILAIIIGGESATNICTFIYKTIYPIIIYMSSVTVLIGLVKMYVAGEKALTPDKPKAKK